ncbi:MAG: hypothetical protein KDJ48_06285 [Nitratireductor sp.]|nr:hypothetical protein [Nitratireductor sp.]MCB1458858.1 hypothetical protein [Nitratireductor sp.]
MKEQNASTIYTAFNALGVITAYVMLALSIHLAPVDLSTKGYWGMGIFLLTLSLVNFVKYRMDERIQSDRISQLEAAKNEKLIEDFVREK